jgi:phosphoribosyl-ATP pyrophosphohydrolase
MAKTVKKRPNKKRDVDATKRPRKRAATAKTKKRQLAPPAPPEPRAVPAPRPPLAIGPGSVVLDRLYAVVQDRRNADPAVSHSARLLSRGLPKVAQKFGEEAVECLIEAVAGNRDALVAESADVLYHLMVLWVAAGVTPDDVWTELRRREGISGIAEKAARARTLPVASGLETTKIP